LPPNAQAEARATAPLTHELRKSLRCGPSPHHNQPSLDQWPSERLNRTLTEATRQPYDGQTHHRKDHLQACLMADNFAKRLKTPQGLTPDEYIGQCWPQEPERFTLNPYPHALGLNI
jgi:hypothetical protein